ncbi:MAG: penicillin-binding protein 2 [candidate division WOR-3 bacterium]|nr:penicillin-binding protein 2 [candidate division WOR-3 bacterium]MDH5683437.1 penicillin-binding protein 2 [candidate division WOR-3 bacterium]
MHEINRLRIVKKILIGFWTIGLVYVFFLQVVKGKKYEKRAKGLHEIEVELLAPRGQIFDRAGRCLALNRSCFSVSVLPQYLKNKNQAAAILAKCGVKNYKKTHRELLAKKRFFWYWKQLDYKVGRKLKEELKKAALSDAISVVDDKSRYYPFRDLLASAVGFVGSTKPGIKKGWAGIEFQFDSILSGKPGRMVLGRDGLGNLYPHPSHPIEASNPGCDILLTLDLDIQQIAYQELKSWVEVNKAIFGSVLVLDVWTGEILAMVDYPDFDPNRYQRYNSNRWTPYAITSEFEPGSSFKLVILATALESQNRERLLKEQYDVSQGYIVVSGKKIKDSHKAKIIDFLEIFIHSSNIGVSLLSQKLSATDFYLTARKLGFTLPTGIELPGEADGCLDKPRRLKRALRFANNSFGQGLRVNLLQLANAYLTVANDGILLKPYIVKEILNSSQTVVYRGKRTEVRQALDIPTAHLIKEILARVVTEGSGVKAALDDYEVCGKTGTAQKLENGRYSSEKSLMTFIGFFPKATPKYLVAILIDEPKRSIQTRFAGDVTGPLFRNIATRIIRLKQIELRDLVKNRPSESTQSSELANGWKIKLTKQ